MKLVLSITLLGLVTVGSLTCSQEAPAGSQGPGNPPVRSVYEYFPEWTRAGQRSDSPQPSVVMSPPPSNTQLEARTPTELANSRQPEHFQRSVATRKRHECHQIGCFVTGIAVGGVLSAGVVWYCMKK